MSDTDKTKPTWVQLYQNPEWRVEYHDHVNHECNINPKDVGRYRWFTRGCHYWASDLGNQHVWKRCSKSEQCYRDKANGHARTKLRKDMRNLIKMTRDDIDDCEFLSYPHRHQALWDAN